MTLDIIFWIAAGVVAYPYLIYPLLLALLAKIRPRQVRRGPVSLGVSFLIAAHNEERNIDRRLTELTDLLDSTGRAGEIILICDGCTDGTAVLARMYTKGCVRVLELPDKGGKARALTQGASLALYPILVFADMRQTWAEDALERLIENFHDPEVGAVSGDLVLTTASGTLAGVGLYWRFEKWLRRQESLVGCQVGVTGAISACRRELFRPIPPGTILDDVCWPLNVALQGYRVVHDSRAVAQDVLPEKTRDEFRRKVRTLSGNFQLALRLPRALIPWRNPVWVQWLSHKLARLLVPWALLTLLVVSLFLEGWFYRGALIAQGLAYSLALLGLLTGRGGKLGSAASSFLVLNSAAWVAFWVWVTGRAGRSWHKVAYTKPGEAVTQGRLP